MLHNIRNGLNAKLYLYVGHGCLYSTVHCIDKFQTSYTFTSLRHTSVCVKFAFLAYQYYGSQSGILIVIFWRILELSLENVRHVFTEIQNR